MSEYAFRSCLENIESDDYGAFKENFELGLETAEAEYLLRVAISQSRKFMVEFLVKRISLTEGQINDCQVFSSGSESLDIFHLFVDVAGFVSAQAWMNLFNIKQVSDLEELFKKYGKPTEDTLEIIHYALANHDPQVHSFAFKEFFSQDLLDTEDKKTGLINCICFSGNNDLLDEIDGTEELKKVVNEKQDRHVKFASQLDEYVELVYKNTPKEKVAKTVDSLGIMNEIQANPQIEDWDIIIQDYLVNEEPAIVEKLEDELSENCSFIKDLIKERKLCLLELIDVVPKEYKVLAKDILGSNEEMELALDRRVYDKSALYICYVVDADGQKYVSSHPMFVLNSKKGLIQLALRKERDKKQQQLNKKKSKGKKAPGKAKLSSAEVFKFLLSEHIKSRKELDDSV